ncbi:MAG TPA: hypothetical protein VGI45_30010 [Terracidiphilus sp.]|jgi:hypothetical protein
MVEGRRILFARYIVQSLLLLLSATGTFLSAQIPDVGTVVQGVDASVKNRIDRIADYTVNEHYVVFRGKDENPAAEMTVQTVYRRASGKSYTILSQNGSSLMRNEVLGTLLDHEKKMSQPGNLETALVNSSNYEMKLDANPRENFQGRDCLVLDITPRRSSEYLFKGKLWVDAHDFAIVQLKGTASKTAFFLARAAEVSRQYAEIEGLPMATHAEAVSGSALLGQTVVKIDYMGYRIELTANR